jgi:adenosylcobinamide-GDP ribazoletransferase
VLSARAERPATRGGPARRARALGLGRRAGGSVRRAGGGLAAAVAFLTIVPVAGCASRVADGLDLADAVPWFGIVGGAIGAAAGAIGLGVDPLFGRGPGAAIVIAALVILTGALHQDGLADTSDGLGVRGDRARRLAVMREPTVGAFGVLALVIWALVLFACLDALGAAHGLRALVAAGAAGRLAAVAHARGAGPARRDGLGAGMRVSAAALAVAVTLGAVVAIAAAGALRGGLALGVCAVMAALSTALARSAFGGATGDTLGATVALTELAVCLALLASWR